MSHGYRLGPRIGRGGMADVHLAVQRGPGGFTRLVVVKRIRAALAARPELVRTLVDEARVLARLNHPNVVQLLDLREEAAGPFLVVEYLPGETLLGVLRELSARGAQLPWPAVCRIGADLAAGLAAAHGTTAPDGAATAILHRDLTPSNVLLCASGAVKLIDFGIARDERGGDTRVGTVKGKLSYLAPELYSGGRAEPRSDLWQLGVVLYEAASGRRLFEAVDDAGRVQAVLRRPIPPLRLVAGEVPFDLERLVTALLARDPAQRPGSAEAVRRALEDTMRRGGAVMTSHELGDWLRHAIPAPLAERAARERACLAGAADPEPDTIVMPPPLFPTPRRPTLRARLRARRFKRITLLAALAALAAALGGTAASHRAAQDQAADSPRPLIPAPIVRPLDESSFPVPRSPVPVPGSRLTSASPPGLPAASDPDPGAHP